MKEYLQRWEEDEIRFPARYAVCENCHGTGKHVNRAIDGNGLTMEDMDEMGPDFFEDYMAGVYDVPCDECHGVRVILVLDEDEASNEEKKLWFEHLQDEYNYQREIEAERRMGC